MDSGRKSGHGRVVLLYFESCEEIWGGSPATTTIASGIESTEIPEEIEANSYSPASSELTSSFDNEAEVRALARIRRRQKQKQVKAKKPRDPAQ